MAFARKQLVHRSPDWVSDGDVFFITVCLRERGSDYLIQPPVAGLIRESMSFYQKQGYWWVPLLVIMPDHLHALISFNQSQIGMSDRIRMWKSYLKRQVGVEWQRGYFDHRLRSADALREKSHYVLNNPVRAGLVEDYQQWPYLWTSDDLNK